MTLSNSKWGDRVTFEARACLETRMAAWIQDQTPIVIYPGGGHTADLFVHTEFCRLNVVGVLDQNPERKGSVCGLREVFPPEAIPDLGAKVILISSPPHHEEILGAYGKKWIEQGLEVIDICEGSKPYSALFPLALSHGLVIDDSAKGKLTISRPGIPTHTIVMASRVWEHSLEIIRNFDWFFQSVIPDEQTSVRWLVDYSGPGYKTLARSGMRLHFPSIPEPDSTNEMYLLESRLAPGGVVLDLGAYAGASTIMFSKAVGSEGIVLALEPDTTNYRSLERNISEHGAGNVLVDASAVWDEDGIQAFEAEGFMGSGLSDVSERRLSVTQVPVWTLESLIKRHGLERVDFIKMDIEGAEVRVLRQSMPLLAKLRPRMVIEPHFLDYRSKRLNTETLLSILAEGGFQTRLIKQGDDVGHPMIAAWFGDEIEHSSQAIR